MTWRTEANAKKCRWVHFLRAIYSRYPLKSLFKDRRFAFLLAALNLLIPPAGVQAQFTTETIGNEIEIIGYTGPGGAVIIPSTINNLPVTSIGTEAFAGTLLTSVAIPASVTAIGIWAFHDCSILTAITVDAQNLFYSSIAGVLFDQSQTTLIQYPAAEV